MAASPPPSEEDWRSQFDGSPSHATVYLTNTVILDIKLYTITNRLL